MKTQARKTLINTAEKKGIPWIGNVEDLDASGAKGLLDEVTSSAVEYPGYYLQPFHAYDEGNLSWQAAFEVESATHSMALRVWPKEEGLTAEAAQKRLRDSCGQGVPWARGGRGGGEVLDVGCSVGISTRAVARAFPGSTAVGLDLSPHFLAVAKHRDLAAKAPLDPLTIQARKEGEGAIEWVHANAEKTGFKDGEFDLVCIPFVFHECPTAAIKSILKESRRILKKGGTIAITDNNPKSPVIQGLPPVLFTLMKSTEPWTDEYYVTDLEACLREAGFGTVETSATDPRHRTVQGQAV
mmetsp:Transcript_24096/g.75521  ORF Transcript_24096/g.75521 Transcript_24096/m.75521 type:complete len:298 (-) Transcript_24096:2638-3531(-)